MSGTYPGPIKPLSDVIPGLRELPSGQPKIGQQFIVQVPLVALTAASTTYVINGFTAPSDGWYVADLFYSAQVVPNYDATTIAVENYDASGNAAANLLSATNENLETLTAKEGRQASLSTTVTNRRLDEGDTIIFTVAPTANEVAAGKGIGATLVLFGPETTPQ